MTDRSKYYAVALVVSLLWWPLLQLAPDMRRILNQLLKKGARR